MSMRIVKNGDVHVSVPIGYPRKLVDDFIAEHTEWIESARKRNAERVKGQDDFFNKLPLQTKAQAGEALGRLDAIIKPMVERNAEIMGVNPTVVYYKRLKSRWGACKYHDKSICFSIYLLLLPEWCIEHVVVHELCHLKEPNHSERFYKLMDTYYPRWREARKETRRLCQNKIQ